MIRESFVRKEPKIRKFHHCIFIIYIIDIFFFLVSVLGLLSFVYLFPRPTQTKANFKGRFDIN